MAAAPPPSFFGLMPDSRVKVAVETVLALVFYLLLCGVIDGCKGM